MNILNIHSDSKITYSPNEFYTIIKSTYYCIEICIDIYVNSNINILWNINVNYIHYTHYFNQLASNINYICNAINIYTNSFMKDIS